MKKAQVMSRAWEIARAAATIFGGRPIEYIRGGAVKMAWAEASHKPATKAQLIEALEAKGFKRWQKGNFDRLYINAGALGLVCSYYRTGNISDAEFCGSQISNCEARRMKASKTFIDVKTWKLHSDNDTLYYEAEKIMNAVMA